MNVSLLTFFFLFLCFWYSTNCVLYLFTLQCCLYYLNNQLFNCIYSSYLCFLSHVSVNPSLSVCVSFWMDLWVSYILHLDGGLLALLLQRVPHLVSSFKFDVPHSVALLVAMLLPIYLSESLGYSSPTAMSRRGMECCLVNWFIELRNNFTFTLPYLVKILWLLVSLYFVASLVSVGLMLFLLCIGVDASGKFSVQNHWL
jgi:hypothetical protein